MNPKVYRLKYFVDPIGLPDQREVSPMMSMSCLDGIFDLLRRSPLIAQRKVADRLFRSYGLGDKPTEFAYR